MVENIIIEGSPFSGKSTLISLLKEKTNKNLIENGFLKDQYLKHWSLWNKSLNNREKNIMFAVRSNFKSFTSMIANAIRMISNISL